MSVILEKVAIKVMPDLDGFRRKVKKDLKRAVRGLDVDIPVGVKLNAKTLRREVATAARVASKEATVQVGVASPHKRDYRRVMAEMRQALETDRIHAQIKVDGKLDLDKVNKELEGVHGRRPEVTIAGKIDPRQIRREMEKALGHARAVKIDTDVDGEKLKRTIDRAIRAANKAAKIELDLSTPDLRRVQATLAWLTRRRNVVIAPEISGPALSKAAAALAALSGARVLQDVTSSLKDMLKGLDRALPKIGGLGLAMANLGSLVLTASSNLFALSASLAQIGGAALALPGILGAMAIGAAVTVLAFKDMGNVLPGTVARFRALQDVISTSFWDKARAPILDMANSVLPILESRLAGTASAIGGYFGSLAQGIQSSLAPALAGMFKDMDASIKIASRSTGAFAQILTVLGRQGAGELPGLAEWFNKITFQFRDFLVTAEKDGRLQGWIDTGKQMLAELGNAIKGVGRIFMELGSIASEAGGSTLAMLAETLNKVADILGRTDVRNGLVGALRAAHEGISNLTSAAGGGVTELIKSLADVLQTVLPVAGATAGRAIDAIARALAQPAVTEGIKAFMLGIQDAVNALAPALGPIGEALGTLLSAIGTALGPVATVLATALVPLANIITALAPPIAQVASILAGVFAGALQAVAPFLVTLAQQFAQLATAFAPQLASMLTLLSTAFSFLEGPIKVLVTDALQQLVAMLPMVVEAFLQLLPSIMALIPSVVALVPLIVQLAVQIAPLALALLQMAITALPPLVSGFLQLITAVMPLVPTIVALGLALLPLVQAVLDFAIAAIPVLVTAISGLVAAVQPVLTALLDLWNLVSPVLIPALQILAQILLDVVVMAINGVTDVINGIVGIVKGVWALLTALVNGDWRGIWEACKQILKAAWDLIKGIVEVAMSVGVLGAVRKGLALVKGLWTSGWNAVKTFGTTIWNGIKSAFSTFMSVLSRTPAAGLNTIKTAFSSAWNTLKAETGRAWDALKSTVTSKLGNVVSTIAGFPARARAAIGDLGGILTGAGRALIDGLLRGIEGAFGRVKSTLGKLTSMLPSWKGPPKRDKVLLTPAGKLIMDGFVVGLESRYDAVRKSLAGLGDEIAGTTFDGPTVNAKVSSAMSRSQAAALAADAGTGGGGTFIYNAAPNNSLESEEDLFSATERARFLWP